VGLLIVNNFYKIKNIEIDVIEGGRLFNNTDILFENKNNLEILKKYQ
jgi:hypothetical protein